MGNDAFSGAMLTWGKGASTLLNVQMDIDDCLLWDDILEGFADYCLWFMFRPEFVDIDGVASCSSCHHNDVFES